MDVKKQTTTIYKFGDFRLNENERLLLQNEKKISLPPKIFEVLLVLLKNHGRLVGKDELFEKVWNDTNVEEATLARTVSSLRKKLRENADRKYIETVAKSGYRFIAPVNVFEETDESKTSHISTNKPSKKNLTNKKNNKAKNRWLSPYLFIPLGLIVVLWVAITLIWQTKNPVVKNAESVKSIAVLPFKTINQTEKSRAIGHGIAETLIIKLNSIDKIIVRPASAVSKYTNMENLDPLQVGRELQVDAILDGSIQSDEDRTRVTVQLIRSEDGTTLWSEKFDAESKDIFALQDDISTRATQALQIELSGRDQKRLAKRYTDNTEAYEAYITGRYLWSRRNAEDLKKSIEYFQKAIEIDPNYALAYTGIADCYQLFAEYSLISMNDGFSKARTAARKALEIDETLAEAHASLGYTLTFYDWDFEAAEKEFKRAIELNPNYATGRHWYGELLLSTGRFEESMDEFEAALKLDPNSLAVIANIGTYHYLLKEYDKTIEIGHRLVEMEPEFPWGYIILSLGYLAKDMSDEYISAQLKVFETLFRMKKAQISELKYLYENEGWEAYWRKRIEILDAQTSPGIYTAWEYTSCYLALGENERAIEWLEKSHQQRIRWVLNIKYNTIFDPIRSDPRVQKIINEVENN